ncbi:MAG: hypothetical protein IT462_05300 [Planctomycetes bacterium]|nr:hypothetical protein [Planctomycetota bacterium]
MSNVIMELERRLADRRDLGRRDQDVKLRLLEDSLKELPKYFVSFVDPQKGVYTFFYNSVDEAKEIVAELEASGIPKDQIGLYSRKAA